LHNLIGKLVNVKAIIVSLDTRHGAEYILMHSKSSTLLVDAYENIVKT